MVILEIKKREVLAEVEVDQEERIEAKSQDQGQDLSTEDITKDINVVIEEVDLKRGEEVDLRNIGLLIVMAEKKISDKRF